MIKSELRNSSNGHTRTINILIILVESGFLYCISGVSDTSARDCLFYISSILRQATILAFTLIKIPTSGTLGDIYRPMNTQFAVCRSSSPTLGHSAISAHRVQGIYPTIVIVLINWQRETNRHSMQWYTAGPSVPMLTSHVICSQAEGPRNAPMTEVEF